VEATSHAGVVDAHGKGGARLYALVWVYLLALTATEVILAYSHVFSVSGMLCVLMALSIVKAGLIMAYFMHLRFEKVSFVLSLLPVVVVVISLLFAFFPDSFRLFELRVR
jgi:cytochrome c oxidase subunit IV